MVMLDLFAIGAGAGAIGGAILTGGVIGHEVEKKK